jgi:hypothetical protein
MFTACNDAEYGIKDNSIYLVDALSQTKSLTIPMESTGARLTVTIRLAKPVTEDVEIGLGLDPARLESFNRINKSSFYSLPPERCDLDPHLRLTIKAGDVAAVKTIYIPYFDTDGKRYALPVAIRVLSGGVEASATQSAFIYVLDKKLFVPTPKFRLNAGKSAVAAKPLEVTDPVSGAKSGGWNLAMNAYTLECWARLEKYNSQNFALFSIYGNDNNVPDNYGCYFRFGDANKGAAEPNGSRNYVNWKAWGAQLTGPFELVANQWNHWALVYDGASLTIYRNGEEYLKTQAKYPGSTWIMHTVDMISSHQGTQNTMNMSQVRLWKKALSSAQLKNGMYYEADIADPDLEAYWKMDEGPDNFNNIFRDATGHGHDAVLNPNVLTGFGWTEPQTFE